MEYLVNRLLERSAAKVARSVLRGAAGAIHRLYPTKEKILCLPLWLKREFLPWHGGPIRPFGPPDAFLPSQLPSPLPGRRG
jgi:hypothetical protein